MLKVFAVRDSALGAFMGPFTAPSSGLAARSFADEVNRKESPMNAHPEDYELFELGEFDEESGLLKSHAAPISLDRGKDVITSPDAASLRAVK